MLTEQEYNLAVAVHKAAIAFTDIDTDKTAKELPEYLRKNHGIDIEHKDVYSWIVNENSYEKWQEDRKKYPQFFGT